MRLLFLKINAFLKGLTLALKPHVLFSWAKNPSLMLSNTLALSKWISAQDKKNILNDFYTAKRDYTKRFSLYQYVVEKLNLKNEELLYLEFGVCGGSSFKWWVSNCDNNASRFYGFDTFEGLPENWGTYKKGEMSANVPLIEGTRHEFVKGLFQDSLPDFLSTHNLKSETRKIIHLDADLFSSTLYVLTSVAPYLKKGDVLLFDEFNVPNHEFFAFKIFCESYYVKTKLIAAVNNYYQVAMVIE